MSNRKINPRILEKIRQNNEGDDAIAEFLIDLIYEEAEHPEGWWWNRTYTKKVKQYSKKWGNADED
jgi:hypothetical protein